MKINVVPYIQTALEDIVGGPVDLSGIHVVIELEAVIDAARNVVLLEPRLIAGADAGQRFRAALVSAGLDDLRVFELGKALDAVIKEASRVQTS